MNDTSRDVSGSGPQDAEGRGPAGALAGSEGAQPPRTGRRAAAGPRYARELPSALRLLLGRCTIRAVPAGSPHCRRPATAGTGRAASGAHGGETVLRLPDPASDGTLVVERPQRPFTAAEFTEAQALLELDARRNGGAGDGNGQEPLALPGGEPLSVRPAGPEAHSAARALHQRCSPRTLAQRYHGPVADVDRYLAHLLSPRFGSTLAVEADTSAGERRLVALGHLLWDGEESEVALLVEDGWQGRGIGGALLRRLLVLAADAGFQEVYAVAQTSNAAMLAAVRGLGLPVDEQFEDGAVVLGLTLPQWPPDPERRTSPLPAAR